MEEDLCELRSIYLEARLNDFNWLEIDGLRDDDFDKDTKGERI